MHGFPFTAHIASLPRLLTLYRVVQARADSNVNYSLLAQMRTCFT